MWIEKQDEVYHLVLFIQLMTDDIAEVGQTLTVADW